MYAIILILTVEECSFLSGFFKVKLLSFEIMCN